MWGRSCLLVSWAAGLCLKSPLCFSVDLDKIVETLIDVLAGVSGCCHFSADPETSSSSPCKPVETNLQLALM